LLSGISSQTERVRDMIGTIDAFGAGAARAALVGDDIVAGHDPVEQTARPSGVDGLGGVDGVDEPGRVPRCEQRPVDAFDRVDGANQAGDGFDLEKQIEERIQQMLGECGSCYRPMPQCYCGLLQELKKLPDALRGNL
jgi:hypothetical protein